MSERVQIQKVNKSTTDTSVSNSSKLFDKNRKPLVSHPPLLQAKLAINQPGDQYEQEADRVAEQVMRMPDSALQSRCSKCNEDEKNDLQTKKLTGQEQITQGQDVPTIVHDVLLSSGQPLDYVLRAFMEPRFGHDFSNVRVHTDITATESSEVINAKAFTFGKHIVFRAGEYAPHTYAGRQLLAHELTHVVQQSNQIQPQIQRQEYQCADLLANPSIMSLVSGSLVHKVIAEHFMMSVPGATKVMIPGASARPLRTSGLCGKDTTVISPQPIGGAAGAGFPDLARIEGCTLQVAEIKPAAFECLIDGEEQLLRYVDQGNAIDPAQAAWRKSMGVNDVTPMPTSTYQPPSFSLGDAQVETSWCSPGLLAYAVRRRSDSRRKKSQEKSEESKKTGKERKQVPQTAPRPDALGHPGPTPTPVPTPTPTPGQSPVPVPQEDGKVIQFPGGQTPGTKPGKDELPAAAKSAGGRSAGERILDFIEEILVSGKNVEQAVEQFLKDNPEIVKNIEVTIAAIVAGAIVSDIISAGTAIAKDPAVAAILAAMLRIAKVLEAH